VQACKRGLLAVAVVWTLGLFAPPASPAAGEADAKTDGGTWGFQKGQQEVALLVGYGFEIDSAGSDKSDMVKNLEFALVRARWGIFLTDRVGQGFLEGNLEFLVEPAFLLSVEPTRRTGYELSFLFRYHFATESRWVPFVTLGAGVIEENFHVTGRSSAGFNFTPQGGPGVSYLLGGNMAVSLEWRLYHVSNANIDRPNVGLNISFVLLGLSFFF
jgi:opacity protein-like surface antigen